MITKEELKRRVDARKEELDAETDKLATFREKIAVFIDGIKSRSVIYNLVKNLPIWQELEKLIEGGGTGAD